MKYFFLLFIVLITYSCNGIAKLGYGAKKPKSQNEISILNWLNHHHFSNANVVSIHPESYYEFFVSYNQTPMLFDRKTGNYVAAGFSNGKFCPKGVDQIFASIYPYFLLNPRPDDFLISQITIKKNDSVLKLSDTVKIHLSNFCTGMYDLKGKPFDYKEHDKSDYILFLPFALFLGNRLQVEDLNKYKRATELNKHSTIKVIFLNLDKQQWWGSEWNKKISIGI